MDSHKKEITKWVNNAIKLENEKQFQGAEESYTRAIYILKNVLQNTSLSSDDRQAVMKYTSDIAKRIQKLRAINRKGAIPRTTSTTALTTPSEEGALSSETSRTSRPPVVRSQSTSTHLPPPGDDYLSFLGDPEYKPSVSKIETKPGPKSVTSTPLASPNLSTSKGSPVASPHHTGTRLNSSSNNANSLIPSPIPSLSSAKSSLTGLPAGGKSAGENRKDDMKADQAPPQRSHPPNYLVPRASEFILKAIEVASQLCQQDELKRAVDVLQHAYHIAKKERNNPSNFKDIQSVLREMRQKYYERYPPRFLQDNPVLPEEMTLLRNSGIITTIRLPCWDDIEEGYGAENIFMPCEGVWEDNFTPQLSKTQKKEGAQLVHIANLYPKGADLAIVRHADPLSVMQTVVGDCSMVCSLIICASYQKRFPKAKIISNVIYPQDRERNPILNPKGKYAVKMLINGMTRLVRIDDRLPANPFTKRLLCTYSQDRTELWVSLMEKAFVKVCGGSYEFPGSTSASDLYRLSGWLPDSLSLTSKDFDANFQWRRLLHSFQSGALLMTLMTPNSLSREVEEGMKLSPEHAYAVLELREVDGLRVVGLRNPWSCQTWGGALAWGDRSELAMTIHRSLGYTKEMAEIGVFWMRWEDVLRYFDGASLSWNPYLLYPTAEGLSRKPTRLACHGTYHPTTSLAEMPQLHIHVGNLRQTTRMHLLFSRHITEVAEFTDHFDEARRKQDRFVALKVFDVTPYPSVAQGIGGGCPLGRCSARRLSSASDVSTYLEPLNDPIYRNAFAHTTSFNCSPAMTDLVVVVALQRTARRGPFDFTVTLHTALAPSPPRRDPATGLSAPAPPRSSRSAAGSNEEARVCLHPIPPSALRYTNRVNGAWVKGRSCGGRSDTATFVYNPQYLLRLSSPTLFAARLSVSDCEESCGVFLLRRRFRSPSESSLTSFGFRVGNLSRDVDFVMKSRLYGVGGALIDSALPETVSYDPYHLLGEVAEKPTTTLRVMVHCAPLMTSSDQFFMHEVNQNDELSMVFLYAMKHKMGLGPSNSVIHIGNHTFEHTKPIQDVLEHARGLESGAKGANAKPHTGEVSLFLKVHATREQITMDNEKDPLASALFNIACDVIRNRGKAASHLSQLRPLIQTEGAGELVGRAPVVGSPHQPIAAFLLGFLSQLSSQPQRRAVDCYLLPPLPAGAYTLIPSLWKKGVAGGFNLLVEATEPFQLEPIPPEGDGLLEQRVEGALREAGKVLPGSFEPPMRLHASDAYFENLTIRISLARRGVFTCRLLLVEATTGGEDAASPTCANLTLFAPHGETEMDMVSSSGPYTSLGISIPPVSLEEKTRYRLVLSSLKPSNCKYVLRIYTSVPCTTDGS
ncbi:unnamed protein product [Phytomonas sp. EM1]|nr:unnamed protein product [Phytomonas sp. EM1]|eukprot:CCW60485.1 unnamed protein product [Phytomonas sp. isolate EM1]